MSVDQKNRGLENPIAKENLDYILKQIKYTGLEPKDSNVLEELQDKLKNNSSNELAYKMQPNTKTNFGNEFEVTMNFKKSERGMWFFNTYLASLKTQKGEERSETFPIKKNGITATQAVNLLEGRATKIKIEINEAEKELFLKYKLNEPRDEKGRYQAETYHEGYGVNVKDIVENKYNLKFDSEELKAKTIKSLEKGNLTSVTYQNGEKGIAYLNPQSKNLNTYNENMQRVSDVKLNTEEQLKKNSGYKM